MDHYRKYQLCLQQNQTEQAIQYLQQHLKTNRQHAAGFYQLGNLLRDAGQWPQALCAFMEACRLDPGQSNFHLNQGVLHQWLQQPEQAIQAYERAWEKDNNPSIRQNRAQALLLAGRYAEGWREYEWRKQVPAQAPVFNWHHPARSWQGQPFPNQTLLIYHEQGLGDDIQFCRYLPYAKALGGKVIFSTKKALIPLMATVQGADQIVEHCPETYETLRFHWAMPLLSLPHFCGTALDNIPNEIPYLAVSPANRDKWRQLLAPYHISRPGIRNIGFVHACNPKNHEHSRTCPLSYWADLFSLPGIQWFSLQKDDPTHDVAQLAGSRDNVIDLTACIDDFSDTAALLERLDLLISVDTSVPHLAGALGKPVWLLLPFANEWRWLLRRSDSPWYPSFRLFRQPAPNQWEGVMTKVGQLLSALPQ